jgi:hypothetical protein
VVRVLKVTGYDQNPALKRIRDMFERAFNDVGEKIRADLKKAYENYATMRFDKFLVTVPKKSGPIERVSSRFGRTWEFDDYGEWSKYTDGSHSHFQTWEDIQKVLHHFKLDLTRAREKADAAYEHARDSFVYKNLGKMQEVLGKRSDLKNGVVRFDWRHNYFKGNVQIYLDDAYFRGDLDIKYVVRTIPNVTPYFQYPLVFVEADVKGQHYARPSEKQLRNLLSGKTDAEHAAEKVAEAAAAGYCPMSGRSVPEKTEKVGRYRACPTCKTLLVPTSNWILPKHKTKEAVKKDAAAKLVDAGYCPMSRQKVPAEIVATIGPVDGYKDPKAPCPACKQQVRLDARKEWIQDKYLTTQGYPTKMTVETATYYKHKTTK